MALFEGYPGTKPEMRGNVPFERENGNSCDCKTVTDLISSVQSSRDESTGGGFPCSGSVILIAARSGGSGAFCLAWAAERQPRRPGGIPGRFIVRRNVAAAPAIVGERRAPPGAILAVCTGYRKMVCTNCVCSGAHCAAVGGSAALRMRRAPCGY